MPLDCHIFTQQKTLCWLLLAFRSSAIYRLPPLLSVSSSYSAPQKQPVLTSAHHIRTFCSHLVGAFKNSSRKCPAAWFLLVVIMHAVVKVHLVELVACCLKTVMRYSSYLKYWVSECSRAVAMLWTSWWCLLQSHLCDPPLNSILCPSWCFLASPHLSVSFDEVMWSSRG